MPFGIRISNTARAASHGRRSFVSGATDEFYLAYFDGVDGSYPTELVLAYSADAGRTWNTKSIAQPSGDFVIHTCPASIIYNSGTIYVAYMMLDTVNGNTQVKVAISTDNGDTWTQRTAVDDIIGQTSHLPFILSGTNLVVGYYKSINGPGEGVFLSSAPLNNTASWTEHLVEGVYPGQDVEMFNYGTTIHFLYTGSGTDRKHAKSTNLTNWTINTFTLSDSGQLFIGGATANTIYGFTEYTGNPFGAYVVYSTNGGTTWNSQNIATGFTGGNFDGVYDSKKDLATGDVMALVLADGDALLYNFGDPTSFSTWGYSRIVQPISTNYGCISYIENDGAFSVATDGANFFSQNGFPFNDSVQPEPYTDMNAFDWRHDNLAVITSTTFATSVVPTDTNKLCVASVDLGGGTPTISLTDVDAVTTDAGESHLRYDRTAGKYYIMYLRDMSGGGYKIYLATSTNLSTWSYADTGITTTAGFVEFWVNNGKIVVIYRDTSSGNGNHLFVSVSTNDGTSWSTATKLFAEQTYDMSVTAAPDFSTIWVMYQDGTDSSIKYRYSTNSGASWSTEALIDETFHGTVHGAATNSAVYIASSGYLEGVTVFKIELINSTPVITPDVVYLGGADQGTGTNAYIDVNSDGSVITIVSIPVINDASLFYGTTISYSTETGVWYNYSLDSMCHGATSFSIKLLNGTAYLLHTNKAGYPEEYMLAVSSFVPGDWFGGVISHTIVVTVNGQGTVVPSGSVVVDDLGSQLFTFTPVEAHRVLDVKVDTVSIGAPLTYTFTNVTADHDLDVDFAVQRGVKCTDVFGESK